MKPRLIAVILAPALAVASCGGADEGQPEASDGVAATTAEPEVTTESEPPQASEPEVAPEPEVTTAVEGDGDASVDGDTVLLRADVWADNWFRLWVNGELVGEDSVPITTERSFNAETFTFEAALPLTDRRRGEGLQGERHRPRVHRHRPAADGRRRADPADRRCRHRRGRRRQRRADWQALVTHIAPLDTSCEQLGRPRGRLRVRPAVDAPDRLDRCRVRRLGLGRRHDLVGGRRLARRTATTRSRGIRRPSWSGAVTSRPTTRCCSDRLPDECPGDPRPVALQR